MLDSGASNPPTATSPLLSSSSPNGKGKDAKSNKNNSSCLEDSDLSAGIKDCDGDERQLNNNASVMSVPSELLAMENSDVEKIVPSLSNSTDSKKTQKAAQDNTEGKHINRKLVEVGGNVNDPCLDICE